MTKEIPLLLLGAGGTAADVLELFGDATGQDGARYRVIGLLDDNTDLHGESVGEYQILGSLADIGRWPETMVADTLGSPRSHRRRAGIVAQLAIDPDRFATLVHPTAVVANSAYSMRSCTGQQMRTRCVVQATSVACGSTLPAAPTMRSSVPARFISTETSPPSGAPGGA